MNSATSKSRIKWPEAWSALVSELDGEYIQAETAEESRILAGQLRKAMRRASEAEARRDARYARYHLMRWNAGKFYDRAAA